MGSAGAAQAGAAELEAAGGGRTAEPSCPAQELALHVHCVYQSSLYYENY